MAPPKISLLNTQKTTLTKPNFHNSAAILVVVLLHGSKSKPSGQGSYLTLSYAVHLLKTDTEIGGSVLLIEIMSNFYLGTWTLLIEYGVILIDTIHIKWS